MYRMKGSSGYRREKGWVRFVQGGNGTENETE